VTRVHRGVESALRTLWLVPVLAGAMLGVALLDRDSGLPSWLELRRELADFQQRIDQLERESQALRSQIAALESDPFAIERAIREDLELARPGEVVVRFGVGPGRLGLGRLGSTSAGPRSASERLPAP